MKIFGRLFFFFSVFLFWRINEVLLYHFIVQIPIIIRVNGFTNVFEGLALDVAFCTEFQYSSRSRRMGKKKTDCVKIPIYKCRLENKNNTEKKLVSRHTKLAMWSIAAVFLLRQIFFIVFPFNLFSCHISSHICTMNSSLYLRIQQYWSSTQFSTAFPFLIVECIERTVEHKHKIVILAAHSHQNHRKITN